MSTRSNIDRALRDFRALSEKQLKQAGARALNKAATAMRNEIPKIIREKSGLPVSAVKDAVQIIKADKNENLDTMKAVLRVSTKPFRLYLFGARERTVRTSRGPRTGVTVKIGGTRKPWPSAFIAKMKSGRVGVFKRDTSERLPIKELTGPSAANLLGYSKSGVSSSFGQVSSILGYGAALFAKEFRAELERAFAKKIKLIEKRRGAA